MDRKKRLLESLDLTRPGLEIGPSHSPVAPKRLGYRVQTIDHLDRSGLVEKYRDHGVDVESIEEVDFVWNGTTYADLTGGRNQYAWIIASHVIEHTPDLIGFINQCDDILGEQGILSLAIPDKRFCFDFYRPITGLGAVIDSSLRKDTIHPPGPVVEYFLNVVSKDGSIAWGDTREGKYQLVHTLDDAKRGMATAIDGTYLDIHRWCFVPHSFRLMMQDLYDLGLIKLREVAFFGDSGSEFFMSLGRHGSGLPMERIDALNRARAESDLATTIG